MNPWVIDLSELSGSEAERIGGKAASLADLLRLGYPVPPSACVTTDAFDHEAPPSRTKSMNHQALVAWLDARPAQGALWDDIKAAVGRFRRPLAVRSSATAEDSAAFSFAGQFESFLYVENWADLVRSIRRCWASVRKETVLEYCRRTGLNTEGLKMAVLIQEMVPAEAAGALFTINPLTGDEHQAVIELCAGTAEELMSGRVTPQRHVLGFSDLAGVKDSLIPASAIQKLLELGRKIQLDRGAPQDIEWAYRDGRLYLLQARPVTKIHFTAATGQWTTADMRDGGVSSYPVTPLMASLYGFAFDRALNDYLRALGLLKGRQRVQATRTFFGRLYWNLGAVKERAAELPGFVEREFDRDLGIEGRYQGDGITTRKTFLGFLKALPLVFSIHREFRRQDKIAQGWIRTLPKMEDDLRRIDLRSLTDVELVTRYRQLITSEFINTEAHYFRTLFNASVSKSDFRKTLVKMDPEEKQISYAGLISGLAPLSHFEPGVVLWKLARKIIADSASRRRFAGGEPCPEIANDIAAFTKRFYYHSRRELDLTVPRWEDDPQHVRQMLQDYVALGDAIPDPSLNSAKQKNRYATEKQKALKLVPYLHRWSFFGKLARLRNFIWLREEMRDGSTRMYYWVRKCCVEIARRALESGRIESEEDVFYLRWDEVPLLLTSAKGVQSIVAQRREERQMYRNFTAPDEIGASFDAPSALRPRMASGARWQGIGVSPGVAVGRCRVVKTLDEANKLRRGSILVCPYTDPAWTPVLAGVAGVITENGGLLSHAAVICREYGIPAALNIPGATEFLTDDMQVRLDGYEGLVERIEPV